MTNPELALANINHIDINRDNNAVLVDGSVSLENIIINKKPVENAELVRFILIATHSDIIYVVTMNYLHGITERSITKDLKSIFASFRIVTS